MSIRIALIEDDQTYADCFINQVSSIDEFKFLSHFGSVEELMESDDIDVDIFVLDHGLPGLQGIDSIPSIKNKFPNAKIVIFSMFDDADRLFKAIQNGASGYIIKTDAENRIVEAINQVSEGGMLFSPVLAQMVLSYFKPKLFRRSIVTDRERDVLLSLKEGLSKKEIAVKLTISYGTVDSHIKNIYKKLHVNDKTKAVIKAIDEGVI